MAVLAKKAVDLFSTAVCVICLHSLAIAAPATPQNLKTQADTTPWRTVLVSQPQNGTTAQVLPVLELDVLSANGIPFNPSTYPQYQNFRVDVWLSGNTGDGVLSGKLQIPASEFINGRVRFTNLKINRPGIYSLLIEGKYRTAVGSDPYVPIEMPRIVTAPFTVSGSPTALHPDIDFDIVYVRYQRKGDEINVRIPDGESPYGMEFGADLMLLHPDRTEEVLIHCSTTRTCSVIDPTISYDGTTVLYTKFVNVDPAKGYEKQQANAFLYKMNLATRVETQLTGLSGMGMALDKWSGNTSVDTSQFQTVAGIRDFAPNWMPDGSIVFASNRQGIVFAEQGGFGIGDVEGSIAQQLHRVQDHDGTQINKGLTLLGHSQLAHIQHPIVLHDGRLLFTFWDMSFLREKYGVATLYTSAPDGTNVRNFYEPHHQDKTVDHWAAETSSKNIFAASYYPGNASFGFGRFLRTAVNIAGQEFVLNTPSSSAANKTPERRYFSRKGLQIFTPHTDANDLAAPDTSGRYSQPGPAPNDGLLFAYSPGPVIGRGLDNPTARSPRLDSGLYYFPNAGSQIISSPSQIFEILNTARYNETQPRAVVPYSRIMPGLSSPPTSVAADNGLGPTRNDLNIQGLKSELAAYIGTSSMQNRESKWLLHDHFNSSHGKSGAGSGAWDVQGTDVGKVLPGDLYGIRILAVVPYHYMKPYSRLDAIETTFELLPDVRADHHVKGSFSLASEKYKILGEWPLHLDGNGNQIAGTNETLDYYGTPTNAGDDVTVSDTSFLAKVPANTTVFMQGIDRYGMTLFTEQTWRHLKPGEVRADCGGCHAHSTEKTPIAFANKKANSTSYRPLDFVANTPYVARAANGSNSVQTKPQKLWDIEFLRDIRPILANKCFSCHTANGTAKPVSTINNEAGNNNSRLSLMDSSLPCQNLSDLAQTNCYIAAIRPYVALARDSTGKYTKADDGNAIPIPGGGGYQNPNASRYIRKLQARRSLLAWKIYGARLDGWTDSDFTSGISADIDFNAGTCPAPTVLTPDEKGLITRWIDIGAPLDFTYRARQRYTSDDLLPLVSASLSASSGSVAIAVNAMDLESGLDTSRVNIEYSVNGGSFTSLGNRSLAANGSGNFTLPVATSSKAAVKAQVFDNAGNSDYVILSWP